MSDEKYFVSVSTSMGGKFPYVLREHRKSKHEASSEVVARFRERELAKRVADMLLRDVGEKDVVLETPWCVTDGGMVIVLTMDPSDDTPDFRHVRTRGSNPESVARFLASLSFDAGMVPAPEEWHEGWDRTVEVYP